MDQQGSDPGNVRPMGAASDAFAAHCSAWNDQDRDRWLTIFAPDMVFEDPVGGLTKRGVEAMDATWAASQTPDRRWILRPERVIECGREVAVDLANHGTIEGREVLVRSIEIWRVRGDGLVDLVRSFFSADPEIHDPYYLPVS